MFNVAHIHHTLTLTYLPAMNHPNVEQNWGGAPRIVDDFTGSRCLGMTPQKQPRTPIVHTRNCHSRHLSHDSEHNERLRKMFQTLTGKTIVITVASSGIGRSTAIEFARSSPQSLRLILTARRLDVLTEGSC